MYRSGGFRPVEIGDVDVVAHDGVYHLFHLVLPNHDLIAHATSEDGARWTPVRNALFVGDPGAFDDDMLWSVHVSADPAGGSACCTRACRVPRRAACSASAWRARTTCTRGARSKGTASPSSSGTRRTRPARAPAAGPASAIRSSSTPASAWRSWRPRAWPKGPPLRRGCVARLAWDGDGAPTTLPPLHHPNRYDDVELPALFRAGQRWWLIGSIREDRKVHLWSTASLDRPFEAPSDNVLLPQGNYAVRPALATDGETRLLWNFFAPPAGGPLLAPPKEVHADGDRLSVRSFSGFESKVVGVRTGSALGRFEAVCGVPGTSADGPDDDGDARLVSSSATELFLLPDDERDVRLRARLSREGAGKFGVLVRVDERGEGYHLSLSPDKALAAIRVWTARAEEVAPGMPAFDYRELQQAAHHLRAEPFEIEVVAFGGYLEASIAGVVVLSLADDTVREGRVGFYVESGAIRVESLTLETLDGPEDAGYRLRG
ncbi:MAG: hypothetical protein U5J97_05720 [Trueperaceae bacterium]|nr:hypothetical protein [Trueperaceae bacterium]